MLRSTFEIGVKGAFYVWLMCDLLVLAQSLVPATGREMQEVVLYGSLHQSIPSPGSLFVWTGINPCSCFIFSFLKSENANLFRNGKRAGHSGTGL